MGMQLYFTAEISGLGMKWGRSFDKAHIQEREAWIKLYKSREENLFGAYKLISISCGSIRLPLSENWVKKAVQNLKTKKSHCPEGLIKLSIPEKWVQMAVRNPEIKKQTLPGESF